MMIGEDAGMDKTLGCGTLYRLERERSKNVFAPSEKSADRNLGDHALSFLDRGTMPH